jgi:hypothetical protein
MIAPSVVLPAGVYLEYPFELDRPGQDIEGPMAVTVRSGPAVGA